MDSTVGRGVAEVKEVIFRSELRKRTDGDYFIGDGVPLYVDQLAGASESRIEGFYGRINDRGAMGRFGAETIEEFSQWAWRSCAIAALQMVIGTLNPNFSKSTMDLVRVGLDMEGYEFRRDRGWLHLAIASLATGFGLETKLHKFVPTSEMAVGVLNDSYMLASVRSRSGGHFWLVFGVSLKNGSIGGFWVHDPYKLGEFGENKFVNRTVFDKVFNHRAISIKSKS